MSSPVTPPIMTHVRRLMLAPAIAAILVLEGCGTQQGAPNATPASGGRDSSATTPGPLQNPSTAVRPDSAGYLAQIARLESEARGLAKVAGCNSAEQCRTAPVGERGCGGPRSYIVYCAATTDSVALFRKLDELKAVEVKYNQSSGMASTCEMRMPPDVTASGGSCRAGP